MFGIDFIDKLASEVGIPLLSKGIKAITGIDITEKELTPEDKQKIMDSQVEILDLDFKKLELELNKTKESNRHEEKYIEVETSDKQNARVSNHLYEMQSEIGKKIFLQTSILIPLLIIVDILLVVYSSDLKVGEASIAVVSTAIGIALNNAYRERQSMIEFLYGSSVGSKLKDK